MIDVMKLAAQAEIGWLGSDGKVTPFAPEDEPYLIRFANLILEEAAKVCDTQSNLEPDDCATTLQNCATKIRAMKGEVQ